MSDWDEVLVAQRLQAGAERAQQLQTETERSRCLQARTEVARRLQAEKDGVGGPGDWDEGLGRRELGCLC